MLQRGIALSVLLPLLFCGCSRDDEATVIRAYYSTRLFTASYRELPAGSAVDGERFSILYDADEGIVGGAAFVSVLSDIDGVDPVWHEVQVSGNQCAAGEVCAVPRQLMSVEEILAAVGPGPDRVHLVPSDTRCSVVGVEPAGP